MQEVAGQAAGEQMKLTWVSDSEGVGKNYLNCSYAQVITGINIEIRFKSDWTIL